MALFTAIATAFTAISTFVGTLGAVGSFLLKTAVGLGVSLLAQKLQGKPEAPTFSIQGKMNTGEDIPRSFVLGYAATAGSLVYSNEWGTLNGTPNAYHVQVIALSDLPVDSLAEVFVNGEKVTLITAEPHPERGFPVKEYRDDHGEIHDYLWVKFYDGTQTVADPYLVARFGENEERKYESTRVGVGIAYAICTARVEEKLFTGFPEYKFALNGLRLYDPSKDSSVGGAGTQRENNPATWRVSHNPVVQTRALFRGITFQGKWVYGLQNLPAVRLPTDAWIKQIRKADVSDASTGNQPIYRAGGEIQISAPISDAIAELMTSCQGRISETGGFYKPHIGVYDEAIATISDADSLSSEEQPFTPFFGLAETINGVIGKYPAPKEGWNLKAAPPVYRPDFEAEDGGRRLMTEVTLTFVPYPAQVQRLLLAAIKEARRARRLTFVLPPEFYGLEAGDVLVLNSNRNGFEQKRFRIDGAVDKANLDTIVDVTEIDPADYDFHFDTDYRVPVDGEIRRVTTAPQVMSGWTVSPDSVVDANGKARRPAIRVTAASGLDDVRSIRVKVRLAASQAVVFDSDQYAYADPYSWKISEAILPATAYEVSGILMPFSARPTVWSAWLPVTTDDIGFSSEDLIDNAVTQQKIAEAAISASKIAQEAVTGVKLANQAVTTAKIALAAVTSLLISDGAVIAAKLADAAVTLSKIQDGAVIASKVAAGAIERDKLAAQAVDATKFAAGIQPIGVVAGTVIPTTKTQEIITVDGKLYRWTNGAYSASVPAVEISGTIVGSQISDAAITSQKLAAAAIDATKFAAGIRPIERLSALPTNGNFDGRTVFLTTDGKLYRYTGGSFTASVPAVDVTGQITSTQIGPNSVTTSKIAANAITANEIAANAITAGKIAAGAVSADQIAANAITAAKIAAGAISADKLAVGTGANNLENSDATAGAAGWIYQGNAVHEFSITDTSNTWTLSTNPAFAIRQPNDNGNYYANLVPINKDDGSQKKFPVIPGERYEVSAYTGAHRCTVFVMMAWFDAAGNVISETASTIQNNQQNVGGKRLTDFLRSYLIVNAPANAVSVLPYVRKNPGFAGSGDSVAFITNVYFGKSKPNQTEPSDYSSSGVTLIGSGNIVTNAITADKIAASAITAGKLAAGAVTAGTIAANAVTAGTIAVGAVSADQIAANAITAVKIAGGTITGDKLAVRTISADSLLAATITGYEIKADTITGSHIAALTVTANELAANSVVAGKLAANAVTAGTIAANAISAINIQGSTITGDKLQGATISGDKLQANTLGAREIAAGSISAKQLVITDFSNLVPDNQMTSAEAWVGTIPGWIVWGDHGLFQSYNGMQFGAGPWGSGSYTNCQSRSFPVKGATSYRFTGAIYSNSNYNAFIRVLWLDANGALASYYDHASTGNRGAGGTGLQTVNLVSPVGAASAIIELFVQRNNTGGPVYFGSIGAFERNAGELIVDGAIKAAQIAADAITTAMLQAGSVTTDKLVVGGVSYDKLAARATGYLGVSANPDAFTITTVFQARVSADVTKPSQDGLEVVASFRVRCTNLGGATSASVQFRLREYLNGAYSSDVEYGKVYFTDTSQDVNDVISAYLIHMKPAGPSGNYSYALEIKKNMAASDFTIGVGRIGVKLGTKTG